MDIIRIDIKYRYEFAIRLHKVRYTFKKYVAPVLRRQRDMSSNNWDMFQLRKRIYC